MSIEPRELMNTPINIIIPEYLLELMNIKHKEAEQPALFYRAPKGKNNVAR
jgi:hypothetical protein